MTDTSLSTKCTRRVFLISAGALFLTAHKAHGKSHKHSWIGYTEFRTNLPGRHANIVTMRACLTRDDGKRRRVLAEKLVNEPNAWTQFAGWSPDGRFAIIGRGWESPENGAWEEEHKTFRFSEGWLYDMYLLDVASGELRNVTAPDRVSNYNTGLFFMPGKGRKLGFQALINEISHPFVMDFDGRNKKDISSGSEGFTYGFNASPDGAHVAYHKDYQVYVADADGANPRHADTGNPFNFAPQWSSDGQWVLFLSGEHYKCHPYVMCKDGSELHKLADRGAYTGAVDFLDVYDFHNGSSDVPVWAPDAKSIYFAAQVGDAVEIMRVTLDGKLDQLTHSPNNVRNYQPKLTPNGDGILFGSNRSGVRQLYLMQSDGSGVRPITRMDAGHGALWPHMRPQ